ncbi:MAG: hypothetical protein KatS3mg065_1257 [Chloroflexota bacterium]|nr:MAG: hypothetical protein KatS3mg065_1257 [Chloroflexota bacterium]
MIRIKRAYDPPDPADGRRVLVDRVWPRGLSKETLAVERWARDLAPSDDLRRWFGHDPARWEEFRRRYRLELAAPEREADLEELATIARTGTLTLVYSARDEEHNQARVLAEVIAERAARPEVS